MELIDQIFSAGLVGCGGAGFPTHAKYKGQFDTVILNGAECEPMLGTDRYLMRHNADEIVTAAAALKEMAGAKDCVIALKAEYEPEIAALTKAIEETGVPVRLHPMPTFFPAGDEQTMIFEVTGRVVPPAGLPANVGCVVSNVATVFGVSNAMKGRPFTQKYLTVTGAVRTPSILKVPVGTPVSFCIEQAGGTELDEYIVINGGPMMGKILSKEEAESAVVTKTTSGLLVLPADSAPARRNEASLAHIINRAKSACIQCTFCTQLCPRHLLGHPLEPHRIMRRVASSNGDFAALVQEPVIQSAALCCECGLCEVYACPMGLQPRRINGMLKKELGRQGIRYQREEKEYTALPEREMRRLPTERVAARAGVRNYMSEEIIDRFVKAVPNRVSVLLRQGIGALPEPCVAVGDEVKMGQLLAACPEGKLGSNLHASICGRVTEVSDQQIVIES